MTPMHRLAPAFLVAGLVFAGCATRPPAPPPAAAAVAPATGDWNAARLEELATFAEAQNSTALLIVQDGRVILRRNWPPKAGEGGFLQNMYKGVNAAGEPLEDVASQQKSFIAVLAAIAIDRGLLDASRPVAHYLGAGWSKAPAEAEARITVDHLLRMTSGLTETLALEHPPGERFFYNTPAYARLKPVLERASGLSLDDMTRDWLAKPLRLADTAWRPRPAALAGADNPTGLVTSPSDLAALGAFILAGGRAPDGSRLVSEEEFRTMLTSDGTNPA